MFIPRNPLGCRALVSFHWNLCPCHEEAFCDLNIGVSQAYVAQTFHMHTTRIHYKGKLGYMQVRVYRNVYLHVSNVWNHWNEHLHIYDTQGSLHSLHNTLRRSVSA